MGKRTIEEFAIGDLVKWYEPYADGDLIRDAGRGIILKKNSYELGFKSVTYVNYEVYRTKHSDKMLFDTKELKKLT